MIIFYLVKILDIIGFQYVTNQLWITTRLPLLQAIGKQNSFCKITIIIYIAV